MPEDTTECTGCESIEIAWFINDKPWCDVCANARFELSDRPFEEDS